MYDPVVYLNGEYLPISQAKVSVLDRGFLFGDGVYEVIPAYGRHMLRLDEHLRRLQNSLDGIRLVNPLPEQQWRKILQRLLDENKSDDQYIYLHISRGVADKRDHLFPDQVIPTVFIMVSPLLPVSKSKLARGISAITLDDIRWHACHIKATTLLANTLLRQQAEDEGAAEAILIRDGFATEGAASNLFMVKNGVLKTPPVSPLLLPGITRDLVLELAQKNNVVTEECDVSEADLESADEIWLTSSTREILPVVQLNGKPVANGQFGPIWDKMIDIYQAYKAHLRQGEV
ncbi:MAG: D-amino acid aminotransferase [Gammaproteobacteria bacterium]|nr:D-amino acid aminotransferase [Gammaproteobacteria bacterium]